MKINRYVYALVVLLIFLCVIAAAMALGLWRTKGGQHRGGPGGHGVVSPTTLVAHLRFATPSAIM